MGERRRGGPGSDSAARADELADLADELSETEPGSDRARRAAQESVDAAQALLAEDDTAANMRRLSRALWRQASAMIHGGMPSAAVGPARRCWQLCAAAMERTSPQDPAFDEVIGELAVRANAAIPVLAGAGSSDEAAAVYEASVAAAGRSDGPRARQAHARLQVFELSALADAQAEAATAGRWDPLRAREEVSGAIEAGVPVIGVLRLHLGEAPFVVTEVARTLQVVGRLYMVAGDLASAAAALDDALRLMATVENRGPVYRAISQGLRLEREGLSGHLPAPATQPDPIRAGRQERAFARAASDMGADVTAPWPVSLAEAVAAVDQLRDQEAADPARYGPRRGLSMAWHASLLLDAGQAQQAQVLADQAVSQLMRFADIPERVQAALVVGLTVAGRAARATGRPREAGRAEQRASEILGLLAQRDPSYADDLGPDAARPAPPAVTGHPAAGPGPEPDAGDASAVDELTQEQARLLEQGAELSRLGQLEQAEETLSGAEGALTLLWGPRSSDRINLATGRYLARARWQLSLVLRARGRRKEALSLGRLGLDTGRILIDTLPFDEPERAEVTAEFAAAAIDLAAAAFAAGTPDEAFALLDETIARCIGSRLPAVRRALGIALHNKANGLLNSQRPAAPGAPAVGDPTEAIRTSAHAVEVRRGLRDPGDLLSVSQLASSLLLLSTAVLIGGNPSSAAGHLAEASDELTVLGPGAAELRQLATSQAALVEHAAPQAAARYRAVGRWPR